jgi:hypothetical protein
MKRLAALAILTLVPLACGLSLTGTGSTIANDGGAGADSSGPAQDSSVSPPVDSGADAITDSSVLDVADVVTDAGWNTSAIRFASASSQDATLGNVAIPAGFTVEIWVNLNSIPTKETYIFSKDQSGQGNNQFRLGVDTDGNAFFMMTDDGGDDHGLYSNGAYKLITSTPLALHTWTHLAASHMNADTGLFVNGVAVATDSGGSNWTFGSSNVTMLVGARVDQTGGNSRDGFFDGAVDDLRVYSVARATTDIAADRARPVGPGDADYNYLGIYLRFDEGTGTVAKDTMLMHNATLENAPTWIFPGAF